MFENQPVANTWSKHPADLYGRHGTVDDRPAEAVLVGEVAGVVSLVAVILVQAQHRLFSRQLFLQPGGDLGPQEKKWKKGQRADAAVACGSDSAASTQPNPTQPCSP